MFVGGDPTFATSTPIPWSPWETSSKHGDFLAVGSVPADLEEAGSGSRATGIRKPTGCRCQDTARHSPVSSWPRRPETPSQPRGQAASRSCPPAPRTMIQGDSAQAAGFGACTWQRWRVVRARERGWRGRGDNLRARRRARRGLRPSTRRPGPEPKPRATPSWPRHPGAPVLTFKIAFVIFLFP